MVAIAIVLVLGGYGTGLMGYSLVRGYDMTLGSFWNPVHPGTWNPQPYTGTSVFPDGKTQAAAAAGKAGSSSASSAATHGATTGKGVGTVGQAGAQ